MAKTKYEVTARGIGYTPSGGSEETRAVQGDVIDDLTKKDAATLLEQGAIAEVESKPSSSTARTTSTDQDADGASDEEGADA